VEADQSITAVLGSQGEPCAECGAPLAADQRYCINCGRRRGGPRVEFAQLLGHEQATREPPEPAAAADPAAAEPAKRERDYTPLAAVGGIAVLGLMLLVGVLIGRGDGSGGTAPAPSIVRVGEPAGAAADAADASEASGDSKGKKKAVKTGAKQVGGGLTGSAAGKSEDTVQASTDDLNDLANQTGEAYEDAIKKLPDKIATPGEAPPIDKSKAPGGGGAAETIE